jgi:thiamine kinase-like enzyme
MLRADRSQFLDALDRLSRTLCHLDLHPANLFARDDTTVAIDWSFVGLGAIGEDAGNLVPDSVLDFHVSPDRIGELHEVVSRGYEAGLREAGWDGPAELVHLATSATIAAKYAWILPALLRAAVEGRELVNGPPFAETIRWWAPTVGFIHERAAEARDLVRSLDRWRAQ